MPQTPGASNEQGAAQRPDSAPGTTLVKARGIGPWILALLGIGCAADEPAPRQVPLTERAAPTNATANQPLQTPPRAIATH